MFVLIERYQCFLKAEGYDHVAQGEAQSKKEAQTLAAWAFIDWLTSVDNLTQIEVGTQISNISSLNLYSKLGFFIRSSSYVLHFHQKKQKQ